MNNKNETCTILFAVAEHGDCPLLSLVTRMTTIISIVTQFSKLKNKMSLNVLVLGGVGFIGRHFVSYLIKNDLVASVRVVDKVLPATAYLNVEHKEVFANPKVEFKQANLVNPGIMKLTV